MDESRIILNLASREYAKAIEPYLAPGDRMIGVIFGERQKEKVIQKGTQAKMARGEMVRFLAERKAAEPETAKEFDRLGYRFVPELSEDTSYVFLKKR